jgi:predicted transcriptional regulator
VRRGALVDVEEARTIDWALGCVRDDRGKSLRVIAGLARMSKNTLQRIETGERSPTLAELAALADACERVAGPSGPQSCSAQT